VGKDNQNHKFHSSKDNQFQWNKKNHNRGEKLWFWESEEIGRNRYMNHSNRDNLKFRRGNHNIAKSFQCELKVGKNKSQDKIHSNKGIELKSKDNGKIIDFLGPSLSEEKGKCWNMFHLDIKIVQFHKEIGSNFVMECQLNMRQEENHKLKNKNRPNRYCQLLHRDNHRIAYQYQF